MIVIVRCNPRHIMARISRGINHDSTVVVVMLLIDLTGVVYNVKFTFEKGKKIKRGSMNLLSTE
jgi:hypothetical protein